MCMDIYIYIYVNERMFGSRPRTAGRAGLGQEVAQLLVVDLHDLHRDLLISCCVICFIFLICLFCSPRSPQKCTGGWAEDPEHITSH